MLRTTLYAAGLTATLLASSAFAQGQFDNFGASSGAGTSGMYMGAALGAALGAEIDKKPETGSKSTYDDYKTGLEGSLTFGWAMQSEQVGYGAEFEIITASNVDKDDDDDKISTTALMVGGITTMALNDTLSGYIGASLGTAGTKFEADSDVFGASATTITEFEYDRAWSLALGGKAGLSWQVNDTTSLIGGYRLLSVGEMTIKNTKNSDYKTDIERRNHHIFEVGARFHF